MGDPLASVPSVSRGVPHAQPPHEHYAEGAAGEDPDGEECEDEGGRGGPCEQAVVVVWRVGRRRVASRHCGIRRCCCYCGRHGGAGVQSSVRASVCAAGNSERLVSLLTP